MNYMFFLKGIINIMANPVKYWETIDSENLSVRQIKYGFLIPLILLGSISTFIGSLFFINSELSLLYSIIESIKYFIVLLFTSYATTFIFSEITYPLDLGKDFNTSFRIIVFSLVPLLMCQSVSRLFESLLFINVIGLYGLYIFWTGSEKFLNPPQYKKMPLLIATTITLLVIYFSTNLILSMISDRIYFAYFA